MVNDEIAMANKDDIFKLNEKRTCTKINNQGEITEILYVVKSLRIPSEQEVREHNSNMLDKGLLYENNDYRRLKADECCCKYETKESLHKLYGTRLDMVKQHANYHSLFKYVTVYDNNICNQTIPSRYVVPIETYIQLLKEYEK